MGAQRHSALLTHWLAASRTRCGALPVRVSHVGPHGRDSISGCAAQRDVSCAPCIRWVVGREEGAGGSTRRLWVCNGLLQWASLYSRCCDRGYPPVGRLPFCNSIGLCQLHEQQRALIDSLVHTRVQPVVLDASCSACVSGAVFAPRCAGCRHGHAPICRCVAQERSCGFRVQQ